MTSSPEGRQEAAVLDAKLAIVEAMKQSFRDVVAGSSNKLFEDTGVTMPADHVWERYAVAALAALSTAIPAGDGVPPGMVMVPREPTREMWAAMADTLYGYKNRHHDKVVSDLWKAMLSTASIAGKG